MPFSLRLDPETEAIIRRLSVGTARSKSQVVRDAVAHYAAERHLPDAGEQSTFARLKAFIGTISTGGANYSKEHPSQVPGPDQAEASCPACSLTPAA
jgi:hypothetical protein